MRGGTGWVNKINNLAKKYGGIMTVRGGTYSDGSSISNRYSVCWRDRTVSI